MQVLKFEGDGKKLGLYLYQDSWLQVPAPEKIPVLCILQAFQKNTGRPAYR